jgi:hypothetical protein
MDHFRQEALDYDVVVCGGGLAGVCAAIAAARGGATVGLIHDRTVLGGNSSSEVRVTPHGAAQFHAYGRETGIISELLIEERAQNHAQIMENGWTNSVWDLVLLTAVLEEKNIELHLNTKILSAESSSDHITSITALVLDAETELHVAGRVFVDSTGDGLVAHSAGCESMFGSEGQFVWQEPHAAAESSDDTMGNSLHFKTEDIGRPVDWMPPWWAKDLADRSFFYDQGRTPGDPRGGFWWIELGTPWHTIYDNRTIRSELQKYVLGIWDWMKNKDPSLREQTRTRALDWVGSVLGTRESRRVIGRTIVTEPDIQERRRWADEVAFGGWFLDLHTPGGLIAEHSEANSATNYNPFTERAALGYVGPYGIPLAALIARDVDNLFLAGRDISASHAALGTMRVMATTALMGQAVGTAAAECVNGGLSPSQLAPSGSGTADEVGAAAVARIRRRLSREGVWLPGGAETDPDDRARSATVTADSQALLFGIHPDALGYAEAHDMIDLRYKDDLLNRVETRLAQPVATDGSLHTLQLYLTNHSDAPTVAALSLFRCGGIHDYTIYPPDRSLAADRIELAPRQSGWITWRLPAPVVQLAGESEWVSGRYVRLELSANSDLTWHQAKTCLIGHPAVYEVALGRMRRLQHGVSLGFQVEPPQRVFGPEHLGSGVTRPHDRTHLWRSDPNRPLPAELTLTWDTPTAISQVELTFAGNLLREYHAYHAFFRDPQTVRDYVILGNRAGDWIELVRVTGNYQRRRVHLLEPTFETTGIRVSVEATNGEPAASLYEIRVY